LTERALAAKTTEAKKEISASRTQKAEHSPSTGSPVERILFLQRTIGNRAVQRLMKSGALQARLRIGAPGDIYEQEADRVAEQVMSMAETKVSENTEVSGKGSDNPVQRACPKCTDHRLSEKEEVLQPKEVPGLIPEITPGLDADINSIRGGGQPLPESVRDFFEPRFGHDFSQTRVHVDAKAAESASAVNALAYTVGRDIVFGAGQYAPDKTAGKRLIAHELTHVMQQSGAASGIQRLGLMEQPGETQLEREADLQTMRMIETCTVGLPQVTGRLQALGLQRQADECGTRGPANQEPGQPLIYHYLEARQRGVDENLRSKRPAVGHAQRLLNEFLRRYDNTKTGTGDQIGCAGNPQRIEAERQSLPTRLKVDCWFGDDTKRATVMFQLCDGGLNSDGKIGDKTWPRLEAMGSGGTTPPPPPPTPIPLPPTPSPLFVCGPDVTTQISNAVSKTKTTFAGWSPSEKTDVCNNLTSLLTGGFAWDIVDLHNNAWILTYRPSCASARATPRCGSSVKVGPDCHYAGSANYVIFGVMCKLCHAHFASIGSAKASDFTESEMLDLINKYKGTGFTGLATPVANFIPSQNWARSGYRGWPAAAQPAGDRTNCSPTCPLPYSGRAFIVHWYPRMF